MIDFTKIEFSSLSPLVVDKKTITGVKQIDGETEVKFSDGTVKRAPRGGYLVEMRLTKN